jgi:hypothetical protein
MELSILQRIILQSVLPPEGDYVTIKIIRDLKAELGFSEEEIKKFNITQEGTKIFWDMKSAEGKEGLKKINIGPKALDIIVKSLKDLNAQKKINEQNADLYELFVVKKGK